MVCWHQYEGCAFSSSFRTRWIEKVPRECFLMVGISALSGLQCLETVACDTVWQLACKNLFVFFAKIAVWWSGPTLSNWVVHIWNNLECNIIDFSSLKRFKTSLLSCNLNRYIHFKFSLVYVVCFNFHRLHILNIVLWFVMHVSGRYWPFAYISINESPLNTNFMFCIKLC